MIFTCDTKDLSAALALAGRVVPAKAPWHVLQSILVATNDDRVTITGSDADTTFETTIPARVEVDGVTLINFATFRGFVKAAKGTEVRIEEAKGNLTVKAGRARIVLQAGEAEDFPNYLPSDAAGATVDAPTFSAALRFAAAAASDEQTKYYLCGVNVAAGEAGDVLTGTDGHRLHMASLPGGGVGAGTIPSAAVPVILSIIEKSATARIAVSDRGWTVDAPPVRAWGKVIDGTFPDVSRVLASLGEPQTVAVADREELAAAVQVAACGADDIAKRSRPVVIRATDGAGLTLWGMHGAAGVMRAGRTEVQANVARAWAGAFSGTYLSATIGSMAALEVAIACTANGGGEILQITPAQDGATMRMRAIVMGIRVTAEELADA